MILTIKLIIIMKCRGRYRTPITTNTELLVTLHNGQKPLNSIKKVVLKKMTDKIEKRKLLISF